MAWMWITKGQVVKLQIEDMLVTVQIIFLPTCRWWRHTLPFPYIATITTPISMYPLFRRYCTHSPSMGDDLIILLIGNISKDNPFCATAGWPSSDLHTFSAVLDVDLDFHTEILDFSFDKL